MAANGRMFIARHGETVFNAAQRMQGDTPHTPLTRAGMAQAEAMGAALADWLGTMQTLSLWSSPSGRALQTMAIMAEYIGGDYHSIVTDARLREIDTGQWGGRPYAELIAESGNFICSETGLFTQVPEGGESYADVGARLNHWLADRQADDDSEDMLVVMHGMSSRVLRGLLLGLDPDPRFGIPVAPSIAQGSLVMIGGGVEKAIRVDAKGMRE